VKAEGNIGKLVKGFRNFAAFGANEIKKQKARVKFSPGIPRLLSINTEVEGPIVKQKGLKDPTKFELRVYSDSHSRIADTIPLREAIIEQNADCPVEFTIHIPPEKRYEVRCKSRREYNEWLSYLKYLIEFQDRRQLKIPLDKKINLEENKIVKSDFRLKGGYALIDCGEVWEKLLAKKEGIYCSAELVSNVEYISGSLELQQLRLHYPRYLYVNASSATTVGLLMETVKHSILSFHNNLQIKERYIENLDAESVPSGIYHQSSRGWEELKKAMKIWNGVRSSKEKLKLIARDNPGSSGASTTIGKWISVTNKRLRIMRVSERTTVFDQNNNAIILNSISLEDVIGVEVRCHSMLQTHITLVIRKMSPKNGGKSPSNEAKGLNESREKMLNNNQEPQSEIVLSSRRTAIFIAECILGIAFQNIENVRNPTSEGGKSGSKNQEMKSAQNNAMANTRTLRRNGSYEAKNRSEWLSKQLRETLDLCLDSEGNIPIPMEVSTLGLMAHVIRPAAFCLSKEVSLLAKISCKIKDVKIEKDEEAGKFQVPPQHFSHVQMIKVPRSKIDASTGLNLFQMFSNQSQKKLPQSMETWHTGVSEFAEESLQCYASYFVTPSRTKPFLKQNIRYTEIKEIIGWWGIWKVDIRTQRHLYSVICSNYDSFQSFIKSLRAKCFFARYLKKLEDEVKSIRSRKEDSSLIQIPDSLDNKMAEFEPREFLRLKRVHQINDYLSPRLMNPLKRVSVHVFEVQVHRPLVPTLYKIEIHFERRVLSTRFLLYTPKIIINPTKLAGHEGNPLSEDEAPSRIKRPGSSSASVASRSEIASSPMMLKEVEESNSGKSIIRILINERFLLPAYGVDHGFTCVLYSRNKPIVSGIKSNAPWRFKGLSYIPFAIVPPHSIYDGWFKLQTPDLDNLNQLHRKQGSIKFPNSHAEQTFGTERSAMEIRLEVSQWFSPLYFFSSIPPRSILRDKMKRKPNQKVIPRQVANDNKGHEVESKQSPSYGKEKSVPKLNLHPISERSDNNREEHLLVTDIPRSLSALQRISNSLAVYSTEYQWARDILMWKSFSTSMTATVLLVLSVIILPGSLLQASPALLIICMMLGPISPKTKRKSSVKGGLPTGNTDQKAVVLEEQNLKSVSIRLTGTRLGEKATFLIGGHVRDVKLIKGSIVDSSSIIGPKSKLGLQFGEHFGYSGSIVWVASGYFAHLDITYLPIDNRMKIKSIDADTNGHDDLALLYQAQRFLEGLTLSIERLQSLMLWRDPVPSSIASFLLILLGVIVCVLPMKMIFLGWILIEITHHQWSTRFGHYLKSLKFLKPSPKGHSSIFHLLPILVHTYRKTDDDRQSTKSEERDSKISHSSSDRNNEWRGFLTVSLIRNFFSHVPIRTDLYANEWTLPSRVIREAIMSTETGRQKVLFIREGSTKNLGIRASLTSVLKSNSALLMDMKQVDDTEEQNKLHGNVVGPHGLNYADSDEEEDSENNLELPEEARDPDLYEMHMMEKMREKFAGADSNISETYLLQTVRGYRSYKDPEEATIDAYKALLEKRKELKIDRALKENPTGWEEYNEILQTGVLGCSKIGRPVYYSRTGMMKPKELVKFGYSKYRGCYIRGQEEVRLIKEIISEKLGYRLYRHIVVIDLAGYCMSHLSRDFMAMVRKVLPLSNMLYPESLEKLYIVNAPFVFTTAWSLLKAFIHSSTQKKITILGSNAKKNIEIMSEHIDPAEIPIWLGGGNEKPLEGICSTKFKIDDRKNEQTSSLGGRDLQLELKEVDDMEDHQNQRSKRASSTIDGKRSGTTMSAGDDQRIEVGN